MIKKICISLIVSSLILAAGCDKKENSGNGSPTISGIKPLDIADAKALFTTKSTIGTRNEEGNKSRLFKVIANGDSEQVKVFDEQNNEVTFYESVVYPGNDEAIVFYFDNRAFIVQKRDGAVFEIPYMFMRHYIPHVMDWGELPPYDKKQNIYMRSCDDTGSSSIYKVTYDGAQINAVKISGEYNVGWYNVDWEGNVVMITGLSGTPVCITPDGTMFLYKDARTGFTIPKYEGGGFFFISWDETDKKTKLYRGVVNSTNKSFDVSVIYDGKSLLVKEDPLYLSNKTVLMGSEQMVVIQDPEHISVYNFELPGRQYETQTDCFAYWSDDTKIARVSFDDGKAETLFENNNYEIYRYHPGEEHRIFVTADDIVHFKGFNITEGKKITGKIENGVFSEETTTGNTSPSLVSFVKIQ